MALLHLMSELKSELGFKLGACYVDHKLRSESGIEAKFVDKICHSLCVDFYLVEFADEFWQDSTANLEEKARNERYHLLEECANRNGFEFIATAHHQDDQVETLLMRIFDRGTGLKGLCGIKAVKCKGEKSFAPTIIRPLLNISKSEIIEYMDGRQYLTDPTNNDTKIRRNYYRKTVIPALEELLKETEFKKHISQLAENAQREREVMEEMMKEFWGSVGVEPCFNPDPCIKPKKGENRVLPLHISRTTIKAHSDNFWMTAFSYLFSFEKRSHSTQTLKDIVAFIRKTDPGTASYNPYIFKRDREGVKIYS